MPENDDPRFFANVKKYALFYAGGGVAALQALRFDIFSFPPELKLYLGYFFSVVTIFCIFLGGASVIGWIKEMGVFVKTINEIKKSKETEPETKSETKQPDIIPVVSVKPVIP